MKAMIFAAGQGTRMKPLTDNQPKALVKVNNVPLIEILINKLICWGFRELIINVHHFPEKITEFIRSKNYFDISVQISDESDQLLDTGGGLKKASWFFEDNEPFLVHNVDVISDINLIEFRKYHIQKGSLATLAVRKRTTGRYLLFNREEELCGWKNTNTGEQILVKPDKILEEFGFSGIQWINPEIFDLITETGRFSLIDLYLRLAVSHKISAFDHSSSFWADVGTLQKLNDVESKIKKYF